MNGLEDRLHEYLAQYGDEPVVALSRRRIAYLEDRLVHPGLAGATGRLSQMPANLTADLLNNLLEQGEPPMNHTTATAPTRVRIHSHVTQSRFLHVEDALNIGKLRLWGGNYRRGQGTDSSAFHFLDLADARVIFAALAAGEVGFSYKEYKGTPPQKDQPAVSRVMSVAAKGENVYIELKTGPGKLTNTGAITPNGPAVVEVNVAFKLYEARRLAATVLAYIQAWDVLRIMVNQHLVGQPVPYLLSPVSSDTSNTPVQSANGAAKPATTPRPPRLAGVARQVTGNAEAAPAKPTNGAARPATPPRPPRPAGVATNNDRPVTRKGPAPQVTVANPGDVGVATANDGKLAVPNPTGNPDGARAAVVPAAGEASEPPTPPAPASPGPWQYQDGTPINATNAAEMQTYQRFLSDKQAAPPSRAALQAYYRQLATA